MSIEDRARKRVLYCYFLWSLWQSVDPHAPRRYETRMDELTDLLIDNEFEEALGGADDLAAELEPQVAIYAKDFVKGMANGLRNTKLFLMKKGHDADLSGAIEEHKLAKKAMKRGDNVTAVRHIITARKEIETAIEDAIENSIEGTD
jgi:hypothetical protein